MTTQGLLFPMTELAAGVKEDTSSTFLDNMRLPVHRWFRYSAGFSGAWAESLIASEKQVKQACVLDPFAGCGTTLIAAENAGVASFGIDSHPFVSRIARAKLGRRSDPELYLAFIRELKRRACDRSPVTDRYPPLIQKCYDAESLSQLDKLRQALDELADDSPAANLAWLTLIGILRKVSCVNTAQWQYILPKKPKKHPQGVLAAFDDLVRVIYADMQIYRSLQSPEAVYLDSDARTCGGVADDSITLVVTSPPYPNNFDYADATRLEMSFMQEVSGWGDLQETVRKRLVRSCSQQVPERAVNLDEVLSSADLRPIYADLSRVCQELAKVRLGKGGKKTYHLMVACYFLDLARVWAALRRVCRPEARICFVVGDSAPYGVYVPVMDWLGALACSQGFHSYEFEQTRDRNVKWKNRKHRVPLREGRLWVRG